MENQSRHESVTVAEGTACLGVLYGATEAVPAAAIAERLGIGGSRESQRRKVRAIVQHLRAVDGKWIVAGPAGYWLTEDRQTWRDYLEGRAIEAKRLIGEASERKQQIADAAGQRLLFAPSAGVSVVD